MPETSGKRSKPSRIASGTPGATGSGVISLLNANRLDQAGQAGSMKGGPGAILRGFSGRSSKPRSWTKGLEAGQGPASRRSFKAVQLDLGASGNSK